MTRRFVTEPIALPVGDLVVVAYGEAVEDCQQLEHFGTPCVLEQTWLEIDRLEETETGNPVALTNELEDWLQGNITIEEFIS